MKSRRNFLWILSRLYILPVLSANAILQACSYNKRDISLPKLKILPLADSIYEGEEFTLKWNAENIETIILKLIDTNGNLIYQTSAVAGIQSFTITDFIKGGQYKIRLFNKDNESVYSESDFFTIQPSRKPVLVISPIQTTLYENEEFTITWASSNITQIQLMLINDVAGTISSVLIDADLKSYKVTIPKAGRYKIKLADNKDQNLSSESQLLDVLSRQSLLILKSPNGGQTFAVLKTVVVEWNATQIVTVNLYYSTNNGLIWNNIVSGIDALAGAYQWKLPDISSNEYLVKIEDAQNKIVFDISDNMFQVIARYDVYLNMHPELSAIGGYKVFQSDPLGNYTLVRISETSFKAYSHICTHNGCTIMLETKKSYRCPCHGSEFDFEGNVTNGPAMRPLDLLTTTFNAVESVVMITK